MKNEKELVYSIDRIYVDGATLKKAIYHRVEYFNLLLDALLKEASVLIERACKEGENPIHRCVSVMVALQDGHGLSAHAMSLRAYVERAAQLTKECRDLSLLGKQLTDAAMYELSIEEAARCGL